MKKIDKELIDFERELHGSEGKSSNYPYRDPSDQGEWIVQYQHFNSFTYFPQAMNKLVVASALVHSAILPISGYAANFQQGVPGFDLLIKKPRMEGNLRLLIQQQKPKGHFSIETLIPYFYNLACGIEYLHENKIVHRKINLSTVLFDKYKSLQIAGFGSATSLREGESTNKITYDQEMLQVLPPETLQSQNAQYSMDVWSLGVVIIELCLLDANYRVDSLGILETLFRVSKIYEKNLVDLLESMLKQNPKERKTMKEVRKTLETHFRWILIDSQLLKEKDAQTQTEEFNTSSIQVQWPEPSQKSEDIDKRGIAKGFKPPRKESLVRKMTNEWETKQIWTNIINQIKESEWAKYFVVEVKVNGGTNLEIHHEADHQKLFDEKLSEFLSEIAKEIENKQLEVKSLQLNFHKYSGLTDDGMKKIGEILSNSFSSVKYLFLNFEKTYGTKESSPQITDKGLEELLRHASDLSELTDFSLSLNFCPNITDQEVCQISKILAPRKVNLSTLKLDFSGCKNVSSWAIGRLREAISREFKLKSLEIKGEPFQENTRKDSLGLVSKENLHFASSLP